MGTEGDGIDSNGYLTINGGTVTALAHLSSMDGGLDADLGVFINGGTVVSVGTMQSELSNSSSQRYLQLMFSTRPEKDSSVSIKDADGNEVAAFTVPQAFGAIAFSSPDLKDGTYTAYLNNVRQQHFGSSSEMGGMGRPFEGRERPEGMGRPEGFGAPPEGMERPEGFGAPPEGAEGFGMPPEGMEIPNGFRESAASGEGSTEFVISGAGITFRGVMDASEPERNTGGGEIKIILKGAPLPLDVAPIIENGRTLVPVRAIFEALGMEVDYNDGEITAAKEGLIIKTTVGSNIFYRNGEEIVLDVGSKIVNNRTLVPVRLIAESAELSVEYLDESKQLL